MDEEADSGGFDYSAFLSGLGSTIKVGTDAYGEYNAAVAAKRSSVLPAPRNASVGTLPGQNNPGAPTPDHRTASVENQGNDFRIDPVMAVIGIVALGLLFVVARHHG